MLCFNGGNCHLSTNPNLKEQRLLNTHFVNTYDYDLCMIEVACLSRDKIRRQKKNLLILYKYEHTSLNSHSRLKTHSSVLYLFTHDQSELP